MFFSRYALAVIKILLLTSFIFFQDPDPNFTHDRYQGVWYEIGKIQTAGGAFFEKDCVCTQIGINITNDETGDGFADNDCRSKTTDGSWTNATGTLYNENPYKKGKWLESFTFGPFTGAPVNYTVIAIGDDYAVEYDCGTSFGFITNYCIHILSRTRTMDKNLFDDLIQQAEEMGLNPNDLDVTYTQQEGC
jgi:apolipoprotein D and lipocalin family protein